MQLSQLRVGKLRAVAGKLSAQMTRLACHLLGALEEPFGLAARLLALLDLLVNRQESPGIFEQPAAALKARPLPGCVQSLDLGAGELVPDDLFGQPLAGLPVDTYQRHQGFDRCLGGDLAAADRLLNRRRKLAH